MQGGAAVISVRSHRMVGVGAVTITRVVSGGQTGVDRAALDVALELGISCGGWCPRGRKAEDGPINDIYPLQETPGNHYSERTEWNVRDSDGTLILTRGKPTGGTALTVSFARAMSRPLMILDLFSKPESLPVVDWLESNKIQVLNVAGPRESTETPVYDLAHEFLLWFFGNQARD